MGSGPKTLTTTSNQYVPSKAEQPGIDSAFQQGYALQNTPQGFYPGQTFMGASAPTQGALAGGIGAAGQMMGMNPALQQSWMRGLNASDVANNPHVQAMMQSNQQMANQNLMRSALPGIQQGALQAGGMNNARQGLAEGQAIGDTQTALANANAGMMLGAYGQGLGHEADLQRNGGGIYDAMMAPWQTIGAAGQTIEGYGQRAIDEEMQRYMWPRMEADTRLDTAIARLGQMKYGPTIGQQPNSMYQSPLKQGLQLASGILGTGMPGGGSFGGNILGKLFPKLGAA